MITKVNKNPSDVFVATDYKKIGKSFELNRQRITNIVYSYGRAETDAQGKRIDEITSDKTITDSEKRQLERELESIMRDFEILGNDAYNADLGNSDEYMNVKNSYDRLVALLDKIIRSSGTYTDYDLNYLTDYYKDYTNNAIILGNLILETTAEIDRINAYNSRVKVDVIITPEAVPVGTSASVVVSVLYDGVEKASVVSPSSFTFTVENLSSGATTSMFTIDSSYTSATVSINSITHTATITNCRGFEIAYSAIGDTGVSVKCVLTLDSDSMPF